jgi:predicted transcriptional regulator
MAELDLDTALVVLANPMRREILSRLVMEAHYPLQLARELNTSQQAVMKHLGVLKRHGLVEARELPSDAGGPPRMCFTATRQLSIRIDMAPNMFNAQMRLYDPDEPPRMSDDLGYIAKERDRISLIPREGDRLKAIALLLQKVNRELSELEARHAALMGAKESLMRAAADTIGGLSLGYNERRVLYYITDRGSMSIATISEEFNLREKTVEEIFFQLMRSRLLFDDSQLLLGRSRP